MSSSDPSKTPLPTSERSTPPSPIAVARSERRKITPSNVPALVREMETQGYEVVPKGWRARVAKFFSGIHWFPMMKIMGPVLVTGAVTVIVSSIQHSNVQDQTAENYRKIRQEFNAHLGDDKVRDSKIDKLTGSVEALTAIQLASRPGFTTSGIPTMTPPATPPVTTSVTKKKKLKKVVAPLPVSPELIEKVQAKQIELQQEPLLEKTPKAASPLPTNP